MPASPCYLAQWECLETLVVPAFESRFSERDLFAKLSKRVVFTDLSLRDNAPPHTIDRGPDKPVLIALNWTESPEDVICLAHEVSHALQIILSDHERMPPVAREACAFLGELIMIEYARETDLDLFPALCNVWRRENDAYLGSDIDTMMAALADPRALYHYRLNYPVARLAAVELFNLGGGDWVRELFAAGREGMRLLPIENMANRAGELPNYFPPLPETDQEQPAINAYQSLGAMALIDIDYWEGESQTRIEEYYSGLLRHLQDRTAFIALDEQRKPIGYATWSRSPQDDGITLTRQAAPFGDHLTLQRALERHWDQRPGVLSRQGHSARREPVAS